MRAAPIIVALAVALTTTIAAKAATATARDPVALAVVDHPLADFPRNVEAVFAHAGGAILLASDRRSRLFVDASGQRVRIHREPTPIAMDARDDDVWTLRGDRLERASGGGPARIWTLPARQLADYGALPLVVALGSGRALVAYPAPKGRQASVVAFVSDDEPLREERIPCLLTGVPVTRGEAALAPCRTAHGDSAIVRIGPGDATAMFLVPRDHLPAFHDVLAPTADGILIGSDVVERLRLTRVSSEGDFANVEVGVRALRHDVRALATAPDGSIWAYAATGLQGERDHDATGRGTLGRLVKLDAEGNALLVEDVPAPSWLDRSAPNYRCSMVATADAVWLATGDFVLRRDASGRWIRLYSATAAAERARQKREERVEPVLTGLAFAVASLAPLAVASGVAASDSKMPFATKATGAAFGAAFALPGAILMDAVAPSTTPWAGWGGAIAVPVFATGLGASALLGSLGTLAGGRLAGEGSGSYGSALVGAALGSVAAASATFAIPGTASSHHALRTGLSVGLTGGGAVLTF